MSRHDAAPMLRLNTLAYGLRRGVLGATDHRAMITLQGCSLNKCPGCTSSHTWSPTGGHMVSVNRLLGWMHTLPRLDGLTVTGGEPTDQAAALINLLKHFRDAFPSAEVVLYSALLWPRLQHHHAALLGLCDAVVAGPYVAGMPPTALAGSANQTVHLLTPLAQRLYDGWEGWPLHRVMVSTAPQTQQLLMVGIPSREMSSTLTNPTQPEHGDRHEQEMPCLSHRL